MREFLFNANFVIFQFIIPLLLVLECLIVFKAWRATSLSRKTLLLVFLITIWALALRVTAIPFTGNILPTLNLAMENMNFFRRSGDFSVAWGAWLHLIFGSFPVRPETVYSMNVIFGTLTVPLVFAFLRLYSGSTHGALAAASFFASMPILAKFSACDHPQPMLVMALFMALIHFTRWSQQKGGGDAFLGGLWLVLCFNFRAESMAAGVTCLFIILGSFTGRLRTHIFKLIIINVFAILLSLYPLVNALAYPGQGIIDNFSRNALISVLGAPSMPVGYIVFIMAGAFFMLLRPWRRKKLFLLLSVVPLTQLAWDMSFPGDETTLRYMQIAFAFFCIVAGLGLNEILKKFLPYSREGKLTGLARHLIIFLLPLGIAIPNLYFLRVDWTVNQEYRFLLKHLPAIPNQCRIVSGDDSSREAGLVTGEHLSVLTGTRHKWIIRKDFLASLPVEMDRHCWIFHYGCSCFAKTHPDVFKKGKHEKFLEQHPECSWISENFILEPLARDAFPAIPFVAESYLKIPVPTGLYRMYPKTKRACQ